MKIRSLLALAFIITTLSSRAQIQKGDVLLGASISSIENSYSGGATSNIGVSPRIAIALGTNWVLGARFNASFGSSNSKGGDAKSHAYGFGATVFARKYMAVKNKLGWYTELGAGAGSNYQKSTISGAENKTSSFSYNAGLIPGIYYQATPKILLSADAGGIKYTHTKNKYNASPSGNSSSFGLNFLTGFTLGVDLVL